MAEVIPFKGIRYGKALGKEIGRLVAPPYDVISSEYRDELYKRHEKNIVRIDFGKREQADTGENNRYTRAADYLERWLNDGTLSREDSPAVYFYEVSYGAPDGGRKTMSGFICQVRLHGWDEGVVLPHEGTLKGPKADRYDLLKATGVSASQIFSLYSDAKKEASTALKGAVSGKAADIEAVDDSGCVHRLWAVKDGAVIKKVQAAMADKKIFIADGHHRYETALAYRDYCRSQGNVSGKEPFNFCPMFLSNMEEEGLTILPTHRLIKDDFGLTLGDILRRAERYFDVLEIGSEGGSDSRRKEFLDLLVEKGKDLHAFGLYFDRGSSYYLLTLKELDPVTEALRCKRSAIYCSLDVTILHELVIERVLGLDTETISESQPVQFEKDGEKAIGRVASGEFTMCFLLNATKVHEVKEVALAREIMPQKSTYFYPKLLTGLVIAELNEHVLSG